VPPVEPITGSITQGTRGVPPQFPRDRSDGRGPGQQPGLDRRHSKIPQHRPDLRRDQPAEIHIYTQGGHGFGIRDRPLPVSSWPQRLLEWMGNRKLLVPAAAPAQP